MSQYGRFLVTMLALDALGYAVVILVTPANSVTQLAALVPVLLVAPFVSRRIVYGDWVTRRAADDADDAEDAEK